MSPEAIKRLFKLKSCTLVAFDGERHVDVLTGSFSTVLTQYYLSIPWKMAYIRLPTGAHYPTDYRK